jgi:hypothetical protein
MTRSEQRVRDLLAESGITDESEELVATLLSLEEGLPEAAPEPSPELAALFANPGRSASVSPLRRRPAGILVAGAVAFSTVTAGGLAAAANELPPGAQSIVADFSERYLPFELPQPTELPDAQSGGAVERAPSQPDDPQAPAGQDAGGDPAVVPAEGDPQEQPQAPAASSPSPSSRAPATPAPVETAPSPTLSPSPSPIPPPSPSQPSGTAPSPGSGTPSTGGESPGDNATAPSPSPSPDGGGDGGGGDSSSPSPDPTSPAAGDATGGIVRGRTDGGVVPTPEEPGSTDTGSPSSDPATKLEPSEVPPSG